jgi:hypothetical protein
MAKAASTLIDAALRGELTETQARQLYSHGREVVAFALAATAKRIAQLESRLHPAPATPALSPSTPSGMIPVYAKPNARRRSKKPGARNGHAGARRAQPARIDRQVEHRLKRCPHCAGPLQRCKRVRSRIIEDIPEPIQPVVTEHLIHRDYCPKCKKHVEPVVPDALPHAALGHQLVGLTSWLHYGLGITVAQIIDVLNYSMHFPLTSGGLVQAWQRMADVFTPWYEAIAAQARASAVLHADETGWRVNGQTYWLWCFANAQVCYYMIDRNRGSPALARFFKEAFNGVLVTDFWKAYASVEAYDRQYCLVHLLRELEKVDERNACADWRKFARHLRRLLRDGFRLKARRGARGWSAEKYQRRSTQLNQRLAKLSAVGWHDADAVRLAGRLSDHGEHILTFLDYPEVPPDNNFAERQIRPAVILRKNSQSNRSEQGAAVPGVLMSVYRTLKLRGLDPTKTIAEALKTYMTTGHLPALPEAVIANG